MVLFCSSLTNIDVKSFSPSSNEQNSQLQKACTKLCDDYDKLFKPDFKYLKNFELQFNPEVKPIFCKPSSVL